MLMSSGCLLMHGTHEKMHVMKTIESIRATEQEAERVIQEANMQAEDILKRGKERVARMKNETNEQVVAVKNRTLQRGKAQVEKEVEELLAKARQNSGRIKNNSFSTKELSKFLKELLSL